MNHSSPVFDTQADAVVELDRWRYEVLPQMVKNRSEEDAKQNSNQIMKPGEKYEGIFMHKDETIKLLDWKL